MKKIYIALLLVIGVFGLVSCGEEPVVEDGSDYYVLPDLNGKSRQEIVEVMERNEQAYEIQEFDQENELYSNKFIMYQNYDTGDIVSKSDVVEVLIYPEFTGARTLFELPDLEGFTKDEVLALFEEAGVNITVSIKYPITPESEGYFANYGSGYEAGDIFYLTSYLPVVVYEIEDVSEYYFPIEMEYDGPLLSDIYQDIDPIDPRGGYFEVTLKYASDGDTAVFNYPQEVYDAIISSAKSTRFLNMDTEETFSGGEEEWGKSGSVYTKTLLESAESIILQTDPGDALTGTYGRLLAWIWIKLPGEDEYFLLNYMVVKQGLAQVKYEFGAGLDLSYGDHTYNEWMHIAEDYAKLHDLGQWGPLKDYYWDYQNDEPFYERWHD
jgi:endonuclease YncB( thermonuclease family)